MFSHTLKRIAVVTVMIGGLALASGNSAEAIEPGVIKVKSIPAPAHESMFRDAISDSRQRSEQIQHDLQLDWFRALAVSSPRAVDTAWISERLEMRGRATTSSTMDARDLVLRHWNTLGAANDGGALDERNTGALFLHAASFRTTTQLTSVR